MRTLIFVVVFLGSCIAGLQAETPDRPIPHLSLNICPTDRVMTRLELFFGATKPDGSQVSWPEWKQFMEEEVTPRFPDGLTVTTAFGQWKNAQGRVVQETSRVLLVVYRATLESNAKVEAIRTSYKARFNQESVLRVDSTACVSF